MITTLSAMRSSLAARGRVGVLRLAIIGALVLVLSGCSALRLGYNNGAQLAWWWVDGYFDFTSQQTPPVKAAIERWFEWHRATQLPEYAALLASLRAQAGDNLSPAQACRFNDELRERLAPAIDRALQQAAELLPSLTETQIRHLEGRQRKAMDEAREEFLHPDPAERAARTLKRAIERSEQLYGRLGEPQRKLIAEGMSASPFNPELWLAERQRRQRDLASTLRRLLADKADAATRLAALRALAERSERAPDAAYREYQRRLVDFNCAFFARVHNATTPAQRQKARDNLKGWEDDLRALIAPPSSANGVAPG
jgi:hypothetical protein